MQSRKPDYLPPPPPTPYFNGVLLLLRVSLMLMAALLCQSTLAQEEKEKLVLPYNLMDTKPDSNTTDWLNGSCNLLDGAHQGVSLNVATYTDHTYEIRYQLPPDCTHFHALVGIDNKYTHEKIEFAFTVFGIDADGNKKKLDSKIAHAGGKPQPIDADLTGIKRLILSVTCTYSGQGNFAVGTGNLWWTDARLSKDKGPIVDPPRTGFLRELAEKLTKGLDAKAVVLNRFVLNPLGFDDNLAPDTQDELRTELGKINAMDVTPARETINDAQKPGWTPGDDLDEKTRAALRDKYDARYFVMGRISDRDEERQIAAATYDLRTGKAVNEGRARIPKPKKPVETTKITLVFKPNSHLNIKSFRWIVDGERKEETTLGSLNSVDIDVPQDAKTIKIGLEWSGGGYRNNKGEYDYKDVTIDDFEVDIQKNKSVELSARVVLPLIKGPDVRGSLEITARVNGRALHPKWH